MCQVSLSCGTAPLWQSGPQLQFPASCSVPGQRAQVVLALQGNYKQILEDNFLPASGPARILSFKEKVLPSPRLICHICIGSVHLLVQQHLWPSSSPSCDRTARTCVSTPVYSPSNVSILLLQAPEQPRGYTNGVSALYDRNAGPRAAPSRSARALPKAAENVLDCPGLVDDYYLNLLDWSSTNVVRLLSLPPPPACAPLLLQLFLLAPCMGTIPRQPCKMRRLTSIQFTLNMHILNGLAACCTRNMCEFIHRARRDVGAAG